MTQNCRYYVANLCLYSFFNAVKLLKIKLHTRVKSIFIRKKKLLLPLRDTIVYSPKMLKLVATLY